MVLYEVMKFCNLGDQSQFETSNLKCIRNEIFDNDFIGPFESAFKDKTIAVYRLLISGLDPKLQNV